MKLRSSITLALLGAFVGLAAPAHAQGFVFGSAAPAKPEAAAQPTPVGARSAKVETAQRLLKRMGLLNETPSRRQR